MNALPASILMNYLFAAVALSILGLTKHRKVLDIIAFSASVTGLVLSLILMRYITSNGSITYTFGGFKPPLGVVYYADFVSGVFSLISSFALLISTMCAFATMSFATRKYLYILAYLLLTGVHGFIFSGDVFHLYVSVELIAISAYAITALYSNRSGNIRAALLYGIAGTSITSFLFLAVIILYGSYGTVNMADIALKSIFNEEYVPYSGYVFGDVSTASIVALALITWVFLFKSGIMPNHFWLPNVYRVTPIAGLILFTSSADLIGIYGVLRLYHVVFGDRCIISSFRTTMMSLLTAMSMISTFFSSLLVAKQVRIRNIVAYSTIAQLSIALSGVVAGVPEAVSGAILHVVASALGDALVLCGFTLHAWSSNKHMRKLGMVSISIGFVNLFGLLPIVPGFWSKALMSLGFLKVGNLLGVIVILLSTGLCAIGYFRYLTRIAIRELAKSTPPRDYSEKMLSIPVVILITVTIGFSLSIILNPYLLPIVINNTLDSTRSDRFIYNLLGIKPGE
ncbi:MAG: proton-conducting transporter membrane subunit [Desulfurococcaceae archaeon]